MRIGIDHASNNNNDVTWGTILDEGLVDSVAEPTTTHGSELSGNTNQIELTDACNLKRENLVNPGQGNVDGNIQQDGLGVLASNLLR